MSRIAVAATAPFGADVLERLAAKHEVAALLTRPDTPAGRSACSTGMPSPSATAFAGGAATLRPRPAGASGRVSSAVTSCVAASRSRTSAPNGAVAATAIRSTIYDRTSRGRSLASASRRASASVRSSISLPSRWSTSCCTTRAG